ncbi:hypothetical protein ACHAW5_004835 [Stephanodiscus triporus]|uniref:SD-repeat containing protein B domain-containing protein n=1 Tax=Stephanodiscus triporus TaxID=2934178 RepID=A0ABD3MIE2_9STRA
MLSPEDDDYAGTLGPYLEDYLGEFFSPGHLGGLDANDELRSLSDVNIEVTVTGLETYSGKRRDRRRRGQRRTRRRPVLADADDRGAGAIATRQNARVGSDDDRRRSRWRRRRRGAEEGDTPRFVAVYDQTTSYRTTDASVSIGTIVRRPFDAGVASDLVERLRAGFPDAFSTLTGIEYVESVPPPMSPAPWVSFAIPSTPPETPTGAPTTVNVDAKGPTTSSPLDPSPAPSPRSEIESRAPISRPVMLTVTGLLWLDENRNGLYETTESSMAGLFVNLRLCEDDSWRGTVQTDSIGQYVFTNLTEGEYYVDFLKPNDIFEFTTPNVGGDDEEAKNSNVITEDSYKGQSECLSVKEGFTKLTNAGFVRKEEGNPPTKAPTLNHPTKPPASEFCAFVSGQQFDFAGCEFPCERQDDCPDDMLCTFTLYCPI